MSDLRTIQKYYQKMREAAYTGKIIGYVSMIAGSILALGALYLALKIGPASKRPAIDMILYGMGALGVFSIWGGHGFIIDTEKKRQAIKKMAEHE